jgi:hypothetical protein
MLYGLCKDLLRFWKTVACSSRDAHTRFSNNLCEGKWVKRMACVYYALNRTRHKKKTPRSRCSGFTFAATRQSVERP